MMRHIRARIRSIARHLAHAHKLKVRNISGTAARRKEEGKFPVQFRVWCDPVAVKRAEDGGSRLVHVCSGDCCKSS